MGRAREWVVGVLGVGVLACGGVEPFVECSQAPVVRFADDEGGAASGDERGIVAGVVRYRGPLPEVSPWMEEPLAEPWCETFREDGRLKDERVLVDDAGGLANAFVFLSSDPPTSSQATDTDVEFVFERCALQPRALGMRNGQTLVVTSADEEQILHNAHPRPRKNRDTSGPWSPTGPRRFKLRRAEAPFPVSCDVHAWERAYVGVFSHPWFAVTDEHGRFTFPEPLPPGTHALKIWHEHLGEQLADVTITEHTQQTSLELTY